MAIKAYGKEGYVEKDPRVKRDRKIIQTVIFRHHLSAEGRENFMMATTVVLVLFGFKLVVRIN
jgi:hypothetical protein